MKKIFLFGAAVCLFLMTTAVSAQETVPNFAGNWELDTVRSKLDERARVEAMTLTVAQTDKELKVESKVKRALRPDADNQGEGRGGNRMGGGFGDAALVFTLDGKETTVPISNQNVSGTGTLKAVFESGGKLKLTVVRKMSTPMGEMTFTTTETWEKIYGGNNLKIVREMETRRGTQTSELYFSRMVKTADLDVKVVTDNSSDAKPTAKSVSAGVLNGKAKYLAKPEYPPAAKAVRASGAVSVQVTFDENGDVIFAEAVSGHALLRVAAEEAAKKSKFEPVFLEGKPIKVNGIIVYNFVP